jgi:hypothetical protein
MGLRVDGARIVLISAGLATAACSAIIGTRDLFYEEGADGGGIDGGSGSDAGGGGTDGSSTTDGGPGTDGGGPCGDTTMNADHCGRCDHSCLGGTCSGGKCQPVALTTGASPRHVALDNTHVFYVDSKNAHVGQLNKDGSAKVDLALGGTKNNYPQGLAIDGTNVYWGGIDGVLFRCAIGGCANAPTGVANTTSFRDLVVDATNVYWIEDTSPNRIKVASKTGTNQNGTQLASAASFNRLAQDTDYLYASGDDGTIRRIAKSNGALTTVGQAAASSLSIAVDGTSVYFSDGDDPASINRAAKTGGANGTPLAASQHHPYGGIAYDANNLFWLNSYVGIGQNNGQVMTCTFAACTPGSLADNQREPISIAVDDAAIYWANFDGGNTQGGIMKLARP